MIVQELGLTLHEEIRRDHLLLCHPDGDICENGCDALIDPQAFSQYINEEVPDVVFIELYDLQEEP